MRRYWGPGFSLTELLVVIAVVAALAALLFPAFDRARERSRQAACLSNMKQIGLAVRLYSDDWNENPPPQALGMEMRDFASASAPPTALRGILPYVRSRAILVCPDSRVYTDAHVPLQLCTGPSCTSYSVNELAAITPFSAIPNPAAIIYLQDFPFRDNFEWPHPFFSKSQRGQGYMQWVVYQATSYSHSGGGNVLYVDGHARWKRHEALRSGDFGLLPPDDAPAPGAGFWGKRYQPAF